MKHHKLPHINAKEHYQFITFRTNDSLDHYLKSISAIDLPSNKRQLLIDKHLDSSEKGAYLYGKSMDIFKNIVFDKNNKMYQVIAMAIMPNHIHLLIRQQDDIAKIMKYIKAKSAIELNRLLKKSGKFWADGYYDRIIRNDEHFGVVYNYILNNPIKANLPDNSERIFTIYG